MKYWNSLGKKKQNQILLVFTFLSVGVYLLGWHWQNYTALKHADNMVNRAENRLQIKKDAIPDAPVSAGKFAKSIAEQSAKKHELNFEYKQLNSIFMPLDDIQAYQSLRLSISDLAEVNGLNVQSINEVDRSNKSMDIEGQTNKLAVSATWGRPLIDYRMRLRFIDLLNFVEGLETLKYQVSVVLLEVEAELIEDDAVGADGSQFLNIQMVLAL